MKSMLLVTVLNLVSFAGCASTDIRKDELVASPEALGLESARLVYTQRSTPIGAEVQKTAYELAATATNDRILSITYPHPNGDIERALAEVVVVGKQPLQNNRRNPVGRIAGWVEDSLPGIKVGDDGSTAFRLEIKKDEVDGLLRAMAAQGMLEDAGNNTAADKLSIAVNGQSQQRTVTRSETLTKLTTRVVNEGRVVSLDEPRIARLVESQTEVARDSFYDGLLQ